MRPPYIIAFCPNFDTTAFYRVVNPGNLFRRYGVMLQYTGALTTQDLCNCDILIIQRACVNKDLSLLLKTAKQLGKKIVFDLDDILWDIPWGWDFMSEQPIESVSYDGQIDRSDLISSFIPHLDGVTCSTEILKSKIIEEFEFFDLPKGKISVLHNFSPIQTVIKPEKLDSNKILIQGDPRHCLYDWQILKELNIAGCKLAIFGMPSEMYLDYGFHMETEFWPEVRLNHFFSSLNRISAGVGLAILHPGLVINQCKSIIKVLEYARMGMSVVASPVGEYNECDKHHTFDHTVESLHTAIEHTIKNPNAEAMAQFTVDWDKKAMQGWVEFYSNMLGVELKELPPEQVQAKVIQPGE